VAAVVSCLPRECTNAWLSLLKAMEEAVQRRAIRWGDLVSPREMYYFTLSDAVGSLPTLLAMAGFFIACVIVVFAIKKALEWILLPRERHRKYVLENTGERDAQNRVIKVWRKMPVTHYGSIVHLALEGVFFIAIIISALFAAAIGNVNIWQSAIASVGIGIIGTYVLGIGLQQAGAGFFFFLTNAMSVNEYWILVGGGIEGRVSRITPFFVELMGLDTGRHGRLQRVSMMSVLSGNWERSFYKEAHEPVIVMDKVAVAEPPTQMGDQQQLLGDEDEGVFEDYDDNEADNGGGTSTPKKYR